MVPRTEVAIALFCPRCGRIHIEMINKFGLHSKQKTKINCLCGQLVAEFISVGRKQYVLETPCLICESNHKLLINSSVFWRSTISKLYCYDENIELGLYGEKNAIEAELKKSKEEVERVIRDTDFDGDDIENPSIMFEIFNFIYDLTENNQVYCRCGTQNLNTEIFPDSIEVSCTCCGSFYRIPATDEKDLSLVKTWTHIELTPTRRTKQKQ